MAKWEIKAFPYRSVKDIDNFGMDLRDYFAAEAMQGIISSMQWDHKLSPNMAYYIADLLIEAKFKTLTGDYENGE
jgi:hypothetical protein